MKNSFILLISCLILFNNCENSAVSKKDTQANKVYQFPEDWKGHWEGDLEIWTVDSVLQKVSMQLIIEGEEDVSWNIVYGEDGLDNRKYFLRAINDQAGHYIIDEMDGIELDCYVKGNKLISGFDVQGSFLSIQEEMTAEGIIYEVVVYDANNIKYTSQTPPDSLTAVKPEDLIKCYTNVSYQKALLKKKK